MQGADGLGAQGPQAEDCAFGKSVISAGTGLSHPQHNSQPMSCTAAESCQAARKSQTPPPAGRRGKTTAVWHLHAGKRACPDQSGGSRCTCPSPPGGGGAAEPLPHTWPWQTPLGAQRAGSGCRRCVAGRLHTVTCGHSGSSWRPGGHVPQQRRSTDTGLCRLWLWPRRTGAHCCFPGTHTLNRHLPQLLPQAVRQQVS